MAETRNHADSAFDKTYAVKYDKAAACLVKDRETMLAFYDFPAEHWKHLRTTNPIESHSPPCDTVPFQGMPLQQDGARHGLHEAAQNLAPPRRMATPDKESLSGGHGRFPVRQSRSLIVSQR